MERINPYILDNSGDRVVLIGKFSDWYAISTINFPFFAQLRKFNAKV